MIVKTDCETDGALHTTQHYLEAGDMLRGRRGVRGGRALDAGGDGGGGELGEVRGLQPPHAVSVRQRGAGGDGLRDVVLSLLPVQAQGVHTVGQPQQVLDQVRLYYRLSSSVMLCHVIICHHLSCCHLVRQGGGAGLGGAVLRGGVGHGQHAARLHSGAGT